MVADHAVNAVRGSGHAPDEIPASHHHRGLHTHLVNFVDFARDPGGSHRINSKALLAYQHLAAQLQQDSVVSRLGHFHTMRCRALSVPWPPCRVQLAGPSAAGLATPSPTLKRAKRRTLMFSPNFATFEAISSPTVRLPERSLMYRCS